METGQHYSHHHHHHHGHHHHSHDSSHCREAALKAWVEHGLPEGSAQHLFAQLCAVQGVHDPKPRPASLLLFCGDGVSADSDEEALQRLVGQAQHMGVTVRAVEVGGFVDEAEAPSLLNATRQAMKKGSLCAAEEMKSGAELILIGVCGENTVDSAIQLSQRMSQLPETESPVMALSRFGGIEIAAAVGAMAQAGSHQRPLLFGGAGGTAAAIVARSVDHSIEGSLIAAHPSGRSECDGFFDSLQSEPVLSMEMVDSVGFGALWALAAIDLMISIMNAGSPEATEQMNEDSIS